MAQDLKRCVIQIRDTTGLIRGTGFIIDANTAVTCAHVIEATDAAPGDSVTITFPLTGGTCPTEVLADAWRPAEDGDIAILRLGDDLPAGVIPAILGPSGHTAGHSFRAFGYPEVGDMQGVWAEGKILGSITDSQGMMMLQLRSQEIKKGMSGAPVLDTQGDRVVGMVTATYNPDETLKLRDAAFATPIDTIQELFSEKIPLHRQIGQEVIRSLIEDPARCFIGDYESLYGDYISPRSVFERVRLDRFAGREWLISQIDTFLNENDRGYLAFETAAGLGKTTFLAHLVRERGYIHHFVELAPGKGNTATGLKNIAAQLVVGWGLDTYMTAGVQQRTDPRPDFLQNLLFEAAQKRDQAQPDEKIVITVDALDEAGNLHGQNALGLPRVLPKGVYIIVSHRPVAVALRTEAPYYVFRLMAEGGNNLADMRTYLEQAATWPGVAQALTSEGYTATEFIEALLHKCKGVWIYLHYVAGEIERGERSPLDLQALPNNLWQYYTEYWIGFRKQDETNWTEESLPLLSTLAAVQEALSLPELCVLAGIPERANLRRLLEETWRPFMVIINQEGILQYRFYHASLREFFSGQVRVENLTEVDKVFVTELYQATRQAHSNIADFFLKRWRGLNTNLRILRHLTNPEPLDLYGLSYLSTHLVWSGRGHDLDRLLALEWSEKREIDYPIKRLSKWLGLIGKQIDPLITIHYQNSWYTAKEQVGDTAGFRSDVELAWYIAEISAPESAIDVGYLCRYALINSSLNSLAANIPSTLLTQLVESKIWSPFQGLTYARQHPDPQQRAETLLELVSHLPESLQGQALHEVLNTLSAIKGSKNELLTTLVAKLTDLGYFKDALDATLMMDEAYPNPRSWVQKNLARQFLEKGNYGWALKILQEIKNDSEKVETLVKLAPQFPKDLLLYLLRTVQTISGGNHRAEAVIGLLSYLTPEQLNEALKLIQENPQNSAAKVEALAKISTHLTASVKEQVLKEALQTALVISPGQEQVKALINLLPHLENEQLKEQILSKALDAARKISDEREQPEALVKLADHLGNEQLKGQVLTEALNATKKISYSSVRVRILIDLLPDFPESYRKQVLQLIVETAQDTDINISYGDENFPAKLAKLGFIDEGIKLARTIDNQFTRAEILAQLALQVTEAGNPQKAIHIALELPEKGFFSDPPRAKVLAHLTYKFIESQFVKEALRAWRLIKDPRWQLAVLNELASKPTQGSHTDFATQVIDSIRALEQEEVRVHMLIALAPHFPEKQKEAIALEALDLTQKMTGNSRTEALIDVIPILPEKLRGKIVKQALAEARNTKRADWRMNMLVELASYVPERSREKILRESLEAAQSVGVRKKNIVKSVLSKTIPYLPGRLTPESLWSTWLLESFEHLTDLMDPEHRKKYQVEVLVRFAPKLSEPLRTEALFAALEIAKTIRVVDRGEMTKAYAQEQANYLVWLTSELLKSEQQQAALEAVRTIVLKDRYLKTLIEISSQLTRPFKEEALQEALTVIRNIEDGFQQSQAITALFSELAKSGHPEDAFAGLWMIRYIEHWTEILLELIPSLTEASRHKAFEEALKVKWVNHRAQVLIGVAPYLTDSIKKTALEEALKAIRIISDNQQRTDLLIKLARQMAILGFPKEALNLAPEINSSNPVEAMLNLIPYLPETLKLETLRKVRAEVREKELKQDNSRAFSFGWGQDHVLTELVTHLVECGYPEEAFEAAQAIKGKKELTMVIVEIIPQTPSELMPKVLEIARRINAESKDFDTRLGFLASIILLRLLPYTSEVLTKELLSVARQVRSLGWSRDEKLADKVLTAIQEIKEVWLQTALREVIRVVEQIRAAEERELEFNYRPSPYYGPSPEEKISEVAPLFQLMDLGYAQICSRLGNQGYPKASVAILTLIRNGDTQADAIDELVKLECSSELFQATQTITDLQLRVKILMQLVPRLTSSQKQEALQVVIALVQNLFSEFESDINWGYGFNKREASTRARMLLDLTPFLPDETVRKILSTILNFITEKRWLDEKDEIELIQKMVGLTYYPQEELIKEILSGILKFIAEKKKWGWETEKEETKRMQTLLGVIPNLPESLLKEMVSEVLKFVNKREQEKVDVLINLVSQLNQISSEQFQALPDELLSALLSSLLQIEDAEERIRGLTALKSQLCQLPLERLHLFWQESLHLMATRSRKDLLLNLSSMTSIINLIGGSEALMETIIAVRHVGRWWP